MRKIILPLAIVATLLSPAIAFAAPTTTDVTIKSLDAKAMTITATDGVVYHVTPTAVYVPSTDKFAQLKAGGKLKLTWDKMGTVNEASKIQVE
ncbi:MAG TPA: hypothetical protein PK286_11430 [Devosia sp.]|nr:hypothetical protein [Devosia sp.]